MWRGDLTDGPLDLAHDLVVGNRFPAFIVRNDLWFLVDFLRKKNKPVIYIDTPSMVSYFLALCTFPYRPNNSVIKSRSYLHRSLISPVPPYRFSVLFQRVHSTRYAPNCGSMQNLARVTLSKEPVYIVCQ